MAEQWDEPRTELLARLWLSGETARTITERLGGGITRNAVIGKAHRLGLTGKQGSKSAAAKRGRKSPEKRSNQQLQRKPRPKNLVRQR
jgi:GcrA cell cycle regulator